MLNLRYLTAILLDDPFEGLGQGFYLLCGHILTRNIDMLIKRHSFGLSPLCDPDAKPFEPRQRPEREVVRRRRHRKANHHGSAGMDHSGLPLSPQPEPLERAF
jgi:hypothetical protein